MIDGYRRTLDVVLRHQAMTLGLFFATLALTIYMAINIPKGFFPSQDTGVITGVSEASQAVSPYEMMRLQQQLGEVILRDPDVAALGSQTGSTDSPNAANTGGFTIVLKPRDQRNSTARQVIDRLRPQFAQIQGANVFLTPAQDINVGARPGRGTRGHRPGDGGHGGEPADAQHDRPPVAGRPPRPERGVRHRPGTARTRRLTAAPRRPAPAMLARRPDR